MDSFSELKTGMSIVYQKNGRETVKTDKRTRAQPDQILSLLFISHYNYRKFWPNVWECLWEPITDTKGHEKRKMETVDNSGQNSLTAPVVESLLIIYIFNIKLVFISVLRYPFLQDANEDSLVEIDPLLLALLLAL